MPIIPKFERQKLASSLVGTPGIDTSGAQIAETIAGVGQKGMQVFGQQAIEKKQIHDAAIANKTMVDFDVALEKSYIDHQKNYKDDPVGKTQFLKDNAQTLLQGFVDAAPSSEVRAHIEQAGYQRIGQKVVNEAQWADKQMTQNTIDATVAGSDTLANEAYIAGLNKNYTRLNEIFNQNEQNVSAAKLALGESDSKKLRKSVKLGAINGLLENHPAALREVLDGEAFKDVLEPAEIKQLKADALVHLTKQKETADTQYLSSQIENHPVVWEKYLAGTLTFPEIEQIDDTRFAGELKELWLKGKPFTAEDKRDKYMNLYGETFELVKGQGTAAYTKGSLEQVVKLQSKIISAVREGAINEEDASSLLKKFAVPTTKALKDANAWFGAFNGMSAPYKRAYQGVRADGKRFNLTPSVQASILVQFDQELAKAENPDSPTAVEVDAAYSAAYQDVIRKIDPRLLKSTVVTNAVGSQAEGVQPIYGGQTKVKADRTIKPTVPVAVYTDEEWAAAAQKRGISVEEAKKRAGVGTDNGNQK